MGFFCLFLPILEPAAANPGDGTVKSDCLALPRSDCLNDSALCGSACLARAQCCGIRSVGGTKIAAKQNTEEGNVTSLGSCLPLRLLEKVSDRGDRVTQVLSSS